MTSVCIHGHFYQPPREDPISGIIPDEAGAEPFKNWNERINAECYRPNAALGNFARLSFNIGPTLFKWLEETDPTTYHLILDQEHQVFEKYGISNALAQPYNHTILPLASREDKITQIKWGIADYSHRFGHSPEGIWLPETAVDIETLEICADNGIHFTILAPWQAASKGIQSAIPYEVPLGNQHRSFIVFFYDQDLSTSVSFNDQETIDGEAFLDHVNGKCKENILIASDGELYGHHKPFRDKFLAYVLNGNAQRHNIEMAFPGLWLKSAASIQQTKILSGSSWSCFHGVDRWAKECGCTPGALWKLYLRQALEKVGKDINDAFIDWGREHMIDVVVLSNKYIDFILGDVNIEEFFKENLSRDLSSTEMYDLELLLQAQYERQKMFSSCGWFFDEFHRIEPQNNIAYCAKSVWLTEKVVQRDLHTHALELLKQVKSEKTGLRGDTVFSQTWLRLYDLGQN